MDKYQRFKEEIFKLTDINLGLYKERQMKRRINSLVNKNGYDDFDDYLNGLKRNEDLFKEFINYLTINVSEFFRNPSQWEVLEKEILPKLINKNKKLKIWSSASSTGEEPYSLVMLLTKYFKLNDISVYATDLDENAIDKAKVGIYTEKSIENVPNDLKNKFFLPIGQAYKVSQEIKDRVTFSKLNLLKDTYPENNHLILCRNVMIYFTEEAKKDMYQKFQKSLTDDGVFFVGSTEQIILSERYNFKPLKTFFYIKK